MVMMRRGLDLLCSRTSQQSPALEQRPRRAQPVKQRDESQCPQIDDDYRLIYA